MLNRISTVNLIISVGSVDGICTTAALLRLVGKKEAEVCFVQAFTVDKLPVGEWHDRKVVFVDLAVNNRDPQMTAAFVARLRENNNELVAVIDEHNREDWLAVLGTFDGLAVEPQSQQASDDAPKSSGEVLRRSLAKWASQTWPKSGVGHGCPWCGDGSEDAQLGNCCRDAQAATDTVSAAENQHTLELLAAADAGDRMEFTTHFGAMVNSAVKSAIADDSRRVYLARHFAANREADSTIQKWIEEYKAILANHDTIVANRKNLGDGVHRVSAVGLSVDMTTLMGRLYADGARVVVLEGEAYNKALGRKTMQVVYGTNDKSLDLLAIVKTAVPTASGFAQKVNVDPEHEAVALAAIRAALGGL